MRTFPIVEKLGGRAAVAKMRGVSVHAIRMWAQRRRIPGDDLAALILAVEKAGIPFEARDLRVIEIRDAAE